MKNLSFDYDSEKDIMVIRFLDDMLSSAKEVDENIFVKRNIKTNEVTSIVILDFYNKNKKTKDKIKKTSLLDLLGKNANMKIYTMEDFLGSEKNIFDLFLKNEKNRINPEDEIK